MNKSNKNIGFSNQKLQANKRNEWPIGIYKKNTDENSFDGAFNACWHCESVCRWQQSLFKCSPDTYKHPLFPPDLLFPASSPSSPSHKSRSTCVYVHLTPEIPRCTPFSSQTPSDSTTAWDTDTDKRLEVYQLIILILDHTAHSCSYYNIL